MLAQGQSSLAKRGGLASDVSSGLIFLTHTQKRNTLEAPCTWDTKDCNLHNNSHNVSNATFTVGEFLQVHRVTKQNRVTIKAIKSKSITSSLESLVIF